ncbi:Glu/Leu/Phe/Val family dehydrogenase [Nonomuraea sp. KM88]|uniref:Glu/Leu/Phe/Val family dehydrogenase n=1 Tax=Nonomuraea sp. KM88 TaxID=3457427 RepID=UPI003FCD0AE2
MPDFQHEHVVVRSGSRSGLPVIIAVHSTKLGQAVGGCRVWRYADWRDGLADALRLSAAMTAKCAVAGLANGGGKTVVALPADADLDAATRRMVLHDVADAITSLSGTYATGPDVGTTPEDMAVIGERTPYVFCKPERHGGSGGSSEATALGTLAALRAVRRRLHGTAAFTGARLAVVGLGSVGMRLARLLAAEGAELVVADIDPARRQESDALGATWVSPEEALTAEVDIVVPAALGGVLTADVVPDLRCAAVAGPANNQLATEHVADLLHRRGIAWVPDHVVSAGGVINTLAVELHHESADEAHKRVEAIEHTVADLLHTAALQRVTPAQAATELARLRLASA